MIVPSAWEMVVTMGSRRHHTLPVACAGRRHLARWVPQHPGDEGNVVPNVTENQRMQRIKELVNEQSKMPPTERFEVLALPVPGGEARCPVIRMHVDEVVLNPNSHR